MERELSAYLILFMYLLTPLILEPGLVFQGADDHQLHELAGCLARISLDLGLVACLRNKGDKHIIGALR